MLNYTEISTETTTLTSIAYQNPKTGGDAVFMARIMLFIDVNDNGTGNKSLVKKSTNKKVSKPNGYKLYPNPNSGEMQLSYSLSEKDNGFIAIYNLLGQEVNSYKLINGATILNINEKQLKEGMYYYQIFINGNKVYSDKIIIIK